MTNPNQDVLKFLEDIDKIDIPATQTKTEAPIAKPDVLSFLDGIAPVEPQVKSVPAPASTTQKSPPKQPIARKASPNAAAKGTVPPQPGSPVPFIPKPMEVPQNLPKVAPITSAPQKVAAPVPSTTVAAPQPEPKSPTEGSGAWNWGALMSTVGTVSTTLTKGLEQAKTMAEDAARKVSTQGPVIPAEFTKFGSEITRDISLLTNSLVETIAPQTKEAVVDHSLPFPGELTWWFCLQNLFDEDQEEFNDFVQATCNDVFLQGEHGRLCAKVTVNAVTDPNPKIALDVDEAIARITVTIHPNDQEIIGKLNKLAQSRIDNDPAIFKPQHSAFLVVQPLYVDTGAFAMMPVKQRVQYLVAIVETSEKAQEWNTCVMTESFTLYEKVTIEMKHHLREKKRALLESAIYSALTEFGFMCAMSTDN